MLSETPLDCQLIPDRVRKRLERKGGTWPSPGRNGVPSLRFLRQQITRRSLPMLGYRTLLAAESLRKIGGNLYGCFCAHCEGFLRGARATGVLTQRGLSNRERESSGGKSWGAKGTIMVPFGPQNLGRETESAGRGQGIAETLQSTARKARTPRGNSTGFSVNRLAAQFRYQNISSPTRTRTSDKAVNSRLAPTRRKA